MHDNENITTTQVETVTTPTETQFVPLSVLTEVQSRLEERAAMLAKVRAEYRDFRENLVQGAFATLVGEGDLARDKANEVLENLGLEKLVRKWTVTGSRNGTTVISVSGVEGDDEDDALTEVRDNLSVSALPESVVYDVEYNGDGDVETNDTYTDEYPEANEDLAEYFLEALEFEVEEEDV